MKGQQSSVMSSWRSLTAATLPQPLRLQHAALPLHVRRACDLCRRMAPVMPESCGVPCAAKLGLLSKGSRGGFLQRGLSGRKAARSDYEEQQVLLGLKAVEKMKQMVLVSSRAQPTAVAHLDQSTCARSPERNVWVHHAEQQALERMTLLILRKCAHCRPIKQPHAGCQRNFFHA